MLFNSYPFIFLFLPVVLAGFFWLAPRSHRLSALWLAAASVFFYAWWNPVFVSLLLASIVFNYGAGYLIGHTQRAGQSRPWLVSAIVLNLGLLAYFKYANFFIATANGVGVGAGWSALDIVLPLGISFFTFTQIAFLVDCHRGVAREYNFIHYLLFVTWFPHLIAGPVLHHKQMMPQFALPQTYRPNAESMAVGLTLFSLGLFKKVVLADQFALYANPVFDAAAGGASPMLVEAWVGALAYTLQLYFDFSGYSDMAIGLSRMFNIKLPLNFNSPYKAANIIDFWRRWHMTLSAFLRDYLYFPLGGNRKGPLRRHINLMATMVLGGLWHGAGWNFVVWGALHGAYLVINHAWRHLTGAHESRGLARIASVGLTFVVVVIAWVPFRSADFATTQTMLMGMAGMNGVSIPAAFAPYLSRWIGDVVMFEGFQPGGSLRDAIMWMGMGLPIIWLLPNTQQWLARFAPAWDAVSSHSRLAWQPTRRHAVVVGTILAFSLLNLNRVSEFLYFQF
jgi:alginate O-acetyltransferase complex protein AlgI